MADLENRLVSDLVGITRLPLDEADLAKAALLIARVEYPDLDESTYLNQLDEMAGRLKNKTADDSELSSIADKMGELLSKEERFRGNAANYYDPENSFLNRVIDRRMGIPISLSLVYVEVGRRAGLTIRGIGLPGHFIVALYNGSGARVFLDPFRGGAILSEDDCRRRVATQYGGSMPFASRFLDPVGAGGVIARLLRNLKGIYRNMGETIKAFRMLEWILAVDPESANEYKERGLLYEELGAYDRAVRDFSRYLELSPNADEADVIEARIKDLQERTSRFH